MLKQYKTTIKSSVLGYAGRPRLDSNSESNWCIKFWTMLLNAKLVIVNNILGQSSFCLSLFKILPSLYSFNSIIGMKNQSIIQFKELFRGFNFQLKFTEDYGNLVKIKLNI